MQVVTPSANGGLLLWAGGTVRALVLLPDELPIHVGGATVLAPAGSAAAGRFYSAGADGYAHTMLRNCRGQESKYLKQRGRVQVGAAVGRRCLGEGTAR